MPDLPQGTVTLLFVNIEGSTHLLQQLEERYGSVLADCRYLIRGAFSTFGGHETGATSLTVLPQIGHESVRNNST